VVVLPHFYAASSLSSYGHAMVQERNDCVWGLEVSICYGRRCLDVGESTYVVFKTNMSQT
jgi:hypothetical protein